MRGGIRAREIKEIIADQIALAISDVLFKTLRKDPWTNPQGIYPGYNLPRFQEILPLRDYPGPQHIQASP